ncbi:MAG: OmpA family protein [Salinivirgaceae bacterium]|nr:OmpA family protein [Salinivirgaceae bacterium]
MPSEVKVYGTGQSRTVLGIANAYLVMHPDATLEELNQAFPGDLNSSNRSETIFVDINDAEKFKSGTGNSTYEMFFFEKEDEVITLKDGRKVAMLELWQKADFDKMVEWAKQYNIIVADYKDNEYFKKGGFTLEYDEDADAAAAGAVAAETDAAADSTDEKNENTDAQANDAATEPAAENTESDAKTDDEKATEEQQNNEKKKKRAIWWILLLLIILILLLILLIRGCSKQTEPQPVAPVPEETVVADTTAVADTVEAIKTKFNAAQFVAAKADLTESSKLVLQELAEMMKKHPEVGLKIVGHASSDGTQKFNQKLSEERAKVAVDYLISLGISADRLQSEGKGSSEPISEDREKNRRTEFIVIK